jgi:hypothetical protein
MEKLHTKLKKAIKYGYKDVEIAKHTDMSPQGVRWHRLRIPKKELDIIKNYRETFIRNIFES